MFKTNRKILNAMFKHTTVIFVGIETAVLGGNIFSVVVDLSVM